MTNKTLQELVGYVQRTHEVDDSGDANLVEYLVAQVEHANGLRAFMVAYLVWANGEDWERFLDNAKVGDIPPK